MPDAFTAGYIPNTIPSRTEKRDAPSDKETLGTNTIFKIIFPAMSVPKIPSAIPNRPPSKQTKADSTRN